MPWTKGVLSQPSVFVIGPWLSIPPWGVVESHYGWTSSQRQEITLHVLRWTIGPVRRIVRGKIPASSGSMLIVLIGVALLVRCVKGASNTREGRRVPRRYLRTLDTGCFTVVRLPLPLIERLEKVQVLCIHDFGKARVRFVFVSNLPIYAPSPPVVCFAGPWCTAGTCQWILTNDSS